MKFTSINQFKQYLIAEGHMSFDGGTATPATKKSPAFTITGYEWADEEEEEENPVELSGETLMQILTTNLEISNDADDFIEKVATHITTSGENKLSAEDELKLMTWYMEQQGEETGNDADEDIDHLIDQINELDAWIHEHTITGDSIKHLEEIIAKYVGPYKPETMDGVSIRDTVADASLSTEELKSLIEELTALKNAMPKNENEIDHKAENALTKYGTFEELKNVLFDVKVWVAPESDDNEHFEPAEGTTPGEEGYYWALNMNYESNEEGVYKFVDKINHNEYTVEIDAADLATDVREHEDNTGTTDGHIHPEENNQPQYAIDKVIAYLGEEFGLNDSAHEGDIKTAMADLGIKHEDYFTIKQDLEDKGWIIEPEL